MPHVALLTTVLALVGAPEDFSVRVIMDVPAASPFSSVRYEVARRGRAATAVHRRELPGHRESLHGMGLLTAAEADALVALLTEVEAARLPDAVAPTAGVGQITWRVEVDLGPGSGSGAHVFRVSDPANQPDRRYRRLVSGVRELVLRVAGDLPFRNVFYPSERLGWASVVSVPVGRVLVDGFDTRLETPLYAYELAAGAHEIRIVTRDGTLDRTYQIRVEPAGTTHLTVDLR